MDTGQVGFHDTNMIFKTKVPKRKNEIVNRVEKTKTWLSASDLEGEYLKRMEEDKIERAKETKEANDALKEQRRQQKAAKDLSDARQRVDTVSREHAELDRIMDLECNSDAMKMLNDLGF